MGRAKSLAQRIAALDEPMEDAPVQRSDEESGSEESDDGLAGTEHYAAVGYVKFFPQFSGC